MVDGYRWGGKGIRSGWHFVDSGTANKSKGEIISTERLTDNDLKVNLKLNQKDASFVFCEDSFTIDFGATNTELMFTYNSLEDTEIAEITENSVSFKHNGAEYGFKTSGFIKKTTNGYLMIPCDNKLKIEFFTK